MVNVKVEIANEQLRDDARLRGCEAARRQHNRAVCESSKAE